MASTSDRVDPFSAFRFEIRIDALAVGGFSECTGLQLETEVQEYAEGGLNTHVHKFRTRVKQSNITLKRGIADRLLYDWTESFRNGGADFKNGSILVHDPSGKEAKIEWQFRKAFPCKWIGPDLNASQASIAMETFELCHQGLNRRA